MDYNMEQFNFLKPAKIEVKIDNEEVNQFNLTEGVYKYKDAEFVLKENGNQVDVLLKANGSLISHIYLTYKISYHRDSYVFGDSIERGYGDMIWDKQNSDRQMFWYFFIKDNNLKQLDCFGVNIQPNSIVSFYLKEDELVVDINTQSGGIGVDLKGRTLLCASLQNKSYKYEKLDITIKEFLSLLMGDIKIKKPDSPVYGFNNWYYAYGESSYKQIMDDTLLLEEITKDNKVIPYMVIDDGWSIHPCSGPWDVNDKFMDMEKLAQEMKTHRVRPGIWFRPLKSLEGIAKEEAHPLRDCLFDPTVESTINRMKEDVSKFVSWGYELIKFDFITVDLYLNYGFEMDKNLTEQGWRYQNNAHTNAEIIKNMYFAIREAAKDALLIGCNAIGHLCAGICELNRTGDDTSGFEWERTRKYGVNSLAYRLYQNDVFYKIDGDCVGHMDKIPWEQNKKWLHLLARSNSPLFVSCDPSKVNEEIKQDLKKAFLINEKENDKCYPIDIDSNLLPTKWEINGEIIEYDWWL